jgi:hypothetical protein
MSLLCKAISLIEAITSFATITLYLTRDCGVWYIQIFSDDNKQLNIHIDFKKGTKFTDSSADTKAYTAYDTKAKTYRHMNFFEHECSNTGFI